MATEFALPYPDGLPLNWHNEQSGVLREALMAYLDNRLHQGVLTASQFEMVKGYLMYYIGAPCWTWAAEGDEVGLRKLTRLRERIANAQTPASIQSWIHACLEIGIDPL